MVTEDGPGQDQDSAGLGVYRTELEKALDKDLRAVAADSGRTSLAKLKVLPTLKNVLDISSYVANNKLLSINHDFRTLQIAIRQAIRRIPHIGTPGHPDLRKPYAEVLALLFGATYQTRTSSASERRESARHHYNEHIRNHVPGHHAEVGPENFRRRIYERELLPLLVGAFLDWEQNSGPTRLEEELRTYYTEVAADGIYWQWKNNFVWLFMLDGYLGSITSFMESYFQFHTTMQRQDVRLPFSHVIDHLGNKFVDDALFSVARVWRLIHEEAFVASERECPPPGYRDLLEECIAWFRQIFSFPEEDGKWIVDDYGLQQNDMISPSFHDEGRDLRLHLISTRLMLFDPFCKCTESPDHSCPVHHFMQVAKSFRAAINDEWAEVGRKAATLPVAHESNLLHY